MDDTPVCPRCDAVLAREATRLLCPHCRLAAAAGPFPVLPSVAEGGTARPNLEQVIPPDARRVFILCHPRVDLGAAAKALGLGQRGLAWSCARSVRGLPWLTARRYDAVVCVEGEHHRFGRCTKLLLLLVFAHADFAVVRAGLLTRQIARACLATLLSPVSRWPLRALAARKRGHLYHRCLNDPAAARAFVDEFLPGTRPGPSSRALDVGCGMGRHAALLSQLGYEVTGLDMRANDYWRLIPRARFYVGSAADLGCFPPGRLDLVLSMLVLCYVADDEAALAGMARLLKDGGRLLLQVPNRDNLRTRWTGKYLLPEPDLRRYYTLDELEAKVRATGLRVAQVWTDKVYAPVCLPFFNFLYEILLPRPLQRLACRLVPGRYRGLINLVAEKVPRSDTKTGDAGAEDAGGHRRGAAKLRRRSRTPARGRAGATGRGFA